MQEQRKTPCPGTHHYRTVMVFEKPGRRMFYMLCDRCGRAKRNTLRIRPSEEWTEITEKYVNFKQNSQESI